MPASPRGPCTTDTRLQRFQIVRARATQAAPASPDVVNRGVDLRSYACDLPDSPLREVEVHSLGGQQGGVLLQHVVLWLGENTVEVVRPAQPQRCQNMGTLSLMLKYCRGVMPCR